MGWMETVKLFSILSPSYMRERDIWLTELLYREGSSSSRLTYRVESHNLHLQTRAGQQATAVATI